MTHVQQYRQNLNIKTYGPGPRYKYYVHPDLTVRKIKKVIDNLNEKSTHYRYVLEPITEGGIELISPDRQGYKSFRFSFENWPIVRNYEVKEEDLDVPLIARRYHEYEKCPLTTCLKAFHGADAWTEDEISEIDALLRSQSETFRLSELTVTELRNLCKHRNLKHSGNKSELIKRLVSEN